MTLAMVATALAPMLITAYYNLNGTLDAVSANELRNLEQLAQSTAGHIAQLLGDSRNLANYVGTDDDFVDFLSKPPTEAAQGAAEVEARRPHQVQPRRAVRDGDEYRRHRGRVERPAGDGPQLQVPRVLHGSR